MSISLEKNPRFQKEYSEWQQRTDKVENMRVKAELEQDLKILLKEVKRLDAAHKNVISQNTIPDAVDDSRHKLLSIRKRIDKKLEDYEKSIKSQ